MSAPRFALLYALCLALSIGGVQAVRGAVDRRPAPTPPAAVPVAGIALPPDPDPLGDVPRGDGEVTYDRVTCEGYGGDLRDTCFDALAQQRSRLDLPGALLACAEVARERLRLECLADAAAVHAAREPDAARASCAGIPDARWRDQCHFGIAMARVAVAPAEALADCEASGRWRDFCRHDVVGEIARVDLPAALAECGREQGDLLTRKTCWHGIGKYVGRRDLDEALAACAQVPPGPDGLYRENCVHGAGWAAGERGGPAATARCDAAGELADSCRLGVAFQVARSDPDEAVAICGTARRRDLREHCLGFVRGR